MSISHPDSESASRLSSIVPYAPWQGEYSPYANWKGETWRALERNYLPFNPYERSRVSRGDETITCSLRRTERTSTWKNSEPTFLEFCDRLHNRESWDGDDRFVAFAHFKDGQVGMQTPIAANTHLFVIREPHDFEKVAESLDWMTSFVWSCTKEGEGRTTYIAIPTNEKIVFADYECSVDWACVLFLEGGWRVCGNEDFGGYEVEQLHPCRSLPLPTMGDGRIWQTHVNRGVRKSSVVCYRPDPEPPFSELLKPLSKTNKEWDDVEASIFALERDAHSEGEIAVGIQQLHDRTGLGLKVLKRALKGREEEEESSGNAFRYPRKGAAIDMLHKKSGGKCVPPDMGNAEIAIADVEGRPWFVKVEEKRDIKLCTPLKLLQGAHFPEKGNVRKSRVAVYTAQNEWKVVEFAPGGLARAGGGDVFQEIMDVGLAPNMDLRSDIVNYLAGAQLDGPAVYTRAGWKTTPDGTHYISPTGQVTPPNRNIELHDAAKLKCTARAGTYEEWRAGCEILFSIPHARPQQAGVLMGLTGVMAALAGDDPTAFYLHGKTGTCKSTSQMGAAAHFADPDKTADGLFRVASGTANSQEAVMEVGSGSLMALDEVSHMLAADIQKVLFMAQAGKGKRRLKKDASEQTPRGWDGGCLILSGEHDLAQRLAAENVVQAGGLSARVMTITTSKENALDDDGFAAVQQMLANYGHTAGRFVEALRTQGYVGGDKSIRKLVDDCVSDLFETQGVCNIQRRRSARMAGYLWAAGIIAKESGLIPKSFDLAGLCRYLWKEFTEGDLAPVDPAIRAARNLCAAVVARRGLDIVNFPDREDRNYREASGYHNAIAAGIPAFVIRADKVTELGGGAAQQRFILEALEDARILIRDPNHLDSRTWSGFPGLAKDDQYVALRADKLEAPAVSSKTVALLAAELKAAELKAEEAKAALLAAMKAKAP